MGDTERNYSGDDLSEMIESIAGRPEPMSLEELYRAMQDYAVSEDEEISFDPWIKRYHDLPSYKLDVTRDGSDMYRKELTEAILAVTRGEYGSIDYKGYKIYYTDTPRVKSISLADGKREYEYGISFQCEAISMFSIIEYESEEERVACLNPENDCFDVTIGLLDNEIKYIDEGTRIKEREKLNIFDFKDYSSEWLRFESGDWDERIDKALSTLSYLMEIVAKQTQGLVYTEEDFDVFADVIRRMVFFADYGKHYYLFELQGLINYEWKPKTKRNIYIWRCMHEFGQGDIPDELLDKCAIYYLLDDPRGWEALAYIIPILALLHMCQDYDPNVVKDEILRVFELIPAGDYRERLEKMIEEDRAKADKGGRITDDQEDI